MAIEQTTRSESASQAHTPGPWEWDYFGEGYGYCLVGASPDHSSVRQPVNVGRDTADGRVIAAAAELLEAGKEAEWFLAHYAEYIASVPVDEIERHPYLPDLHEKIEMLRAAIAKARGDVL